MGAADHGAGSPALRLRVLLHARGGQVSRGVSFCFPLSSLASTAVRNFRSVVCVYFILFLIVLCTIFFASPDFYVVSKPI